MAERNSLLDILSKMYGARGALPAYAADRMPAVANALLDAVKTPGDVYAGRKDPTVENAMPLLGLIIGGNVAAAPLRRSVRGKIDFLSRKAYSGEGTPRGYERSFHDDYAKGYDGAGGGRLTETMDGAPITAPVVAGRREVFGPDVPISDGELRSVLDTIVDRWREGGKRETGGNAGIFRRTAGKDGPETEIVVLDSLSEAAKQRTLRHEAGHAIENRIDPYSGMDITGVEAKLGRIFSDLNNPSPKGKVAPKDFGYRGSEVDRELVAEALRAYMQNPAYIKTVAPSVAKRIREAVNTNPRLRDIIQFNALLATAGVALPDRENQ